MAEQTNKGLDSPFGPVARAVGAAAARQKVVPTANRENFAVKMAMDVVGEEPEWAGY